MFIIHSIFWIDGIVFISVIISKDINSDLENIITFPGSWTWFWFVWTFTIGISTIWGIFFSPFIFTSDNTIVEFTNVNPVIVVLITLGEEEV